MRSYVYLIRVFQGRKSKSLSIGVELRRVGIRSDAQGVVIGNSIDIRTIWRAFIEGIPGARRPFDTVTKERVPTKSQLQMYSLTADDLN